MTEGKDTPETKAAPISLHVSEPTINKSDDLLGRVKEIENLSPVLLNVQAPLVFAIDAPWGGGKTTFIKLWEQYLESENKEGLYLNCWENDFVDDPLLPMLSVLDSWLSKPANNSKLKEAWEMGKKLAPVILKSVATAAVEKATAGMVKPEKIEASMAAGSLVDSFNAKKQALTEFKKQIATAMDALPDDQQNLIIFIDELDRCRPTYAIEVLERIKHLFDIERIVFVLAINREQLAKSLQGVYGPSFDGNHYLKRFIDLDYQLQVPDQSDYISDRLDLNDLKDYFNRNKINGKFDSTKNCIAEMIQRFDYQLRDIDQLIMRLRLVLKSIFSDAHYIELEVLSALLILREQNQELYEQYKADGCVNKVITYLLGNIKTDRWADCFAGVGGQLILASIDLNKSEEKSKMIKYWKGLAESPELEQDHKSKIGCLINIIKTSGNAMKNYDGIRKLTLERIELISKITI